MSQLSVGCHTVSITLPRRQFLLRIWPIQLAFLWKARYRCINFVYLISLTSYGNLIGVRHAWLIKTQNQRSLVMRFSSYVNHNNICLLAMNWRSFIYYSVKTLMWFLLITWMFYNITRREIDFIISLEKSATSERIQYRNPLSICMQFHKLKCT